MSTWDIPMCTCLKKIKPYIGAGFGYSWLEMSYNVMEPKGGKERDLAWNAGLGVAYELNDNVDLTLGYRYEDLGTFKKEEIKAKFRNQRISLGLRYTF